MKILELFSGTECLSNAFRARGHQCFTVDWDTRFPSSLHTDIMQLTAQRILTDFGRPDIIWAGCDCTTFSVAAIGHHRRKDPATGSLEPKTEQAARADEVNRHTLRIIRSLRPRFFFIENPMGGLRKMDYMQGIPRHLITYCQYGFTYRRGHRHLDEPPAARVPAAVQERRPLPSAGTPRHQAGTAGHTGQGTALGISSEAVRAHRQHLRTVLRPRAAARPLAHRRQAARAAGVVLNTDYTDYTDYFFEHEGCD